MDLAADVGSGDFALEEDTKVDDNIEQGKSKEVECEFICID